jgi:hypothetical protein
LKIKNVPIITLITNPVRVPLINTPAIVTVTRKRTAPAMNFTITVFVRRVRWKKGWTALRYLSIVNPDRTTIDKLLDKNAADLGNNIKVQMSKFVYGKSRYKIVTGMARHANPRSTED